MALDYNCYVLSRRFSKNIVVFLRYYIIQVGATRALHVSNSFFLFVSVFFSLYLPVHRLLFSALSFFLSLSLSLFLAYGAKSLIILINAEKIPPPQKKKTLFNTCGA
jgi:hypothetical protein